LEISNLVDYEQLFALELKHPKTDEPLGITFQIRSSGSERAKEVQRKHTDKNLERLMKRKTLTSDRVETEELEKAASYIASWDWGSDPKTGEPNLYAGTVPELTMKTAIAILDKEGWIFGQVVEAASKLENFSTDSRKS